MLLPKDYVRYRLTGDRATDVADASGTLLFDVGGRRWSGDMLDAMELDAAILPRAYESPEVTGTRVAPRARRPTGLRQGTPVVAGGGDQAAGAVGMGIVRAGRGQRHDRHVGRRVCGHRQAGARSRRAASTRSVTRCRDAGTSWA